MAPLLLKLIFGCAAFLSNFVSSLSVLPKSSNCPKPPEICPNKNITFHLYNRRIKHPDGYQLKEFDPTTIQNAPFIKNRKVIIMSHGYTGSLHSSPNKELLDAYSRVPEPVNIIALEWSKLCPQPCYTQSARNVALVGNCTAIFIETLLQHQTWFDLKHIHFIGFSLGAQVASQAARRLTIGKFSWITGLDPAFPLFFTFTTDADERLDTTDADFIDVYHTNAGYKGQLTSIGHVDFYANHALIQPGCGTDSSCNHLRAVQYYAESVYTKVGFYAHECVSILTHLTGICGAVRADEQVLLGAHLNHSLRGTYYFTTNDQYPFAKGRVSENDENAIQRIEHDVDLEKSKLTDDHKPASPSQLQRRKPDRLIRPWTWS